MVDEAETMRTIRNVLAEVGWPTHIWTGRDWWERPDPMCPARKAEARQMGWLDDEQ